MPTVAVRSNVGELKTDRNVPRSIEGIALIRPDDRTQSPLRTSYPCIVSEVANPRRDAINNSVSVARLRVVS
jgi:hypothetical protein